LLTTECTQSEFELTGHFSRSVVARFDGGTMSSEGGALLLRETDRRLQLLPRLATCFRDERSAGYISHTVQELVAQRVYGLALGYEDLSDHDQLRHDPLLAMVSGKSAAGEACLAGKSTLNRLELSTGEADRYKKIQCETTAVDELLVNVFLEAHASAPERIVLDLDVTDLALHGHQEGRYASFTVTMTATVICRCTSSAVSTCCVCACEPPIKMLRRGAQPKWSASWRTSAASGRRWKSFCGPIPAFVGKS
jgi:hypothetical protein